MQEIHLEEEELESPTHLLFDGCHLPSSTDDSARTMDVLPRLKGVRLRSSYECIVDYLPYLTEDPVSTLENALRSAIWSSKGALEAQCMLEAYRDHHCVHELVERMLKRLKAEEEHSPDEGSRLNARARLKGIRRVRAGLRKGIPFITRDGSPLFDDLCK